MGFKCNFLGHNWVYMKHKTGQFGEYSHEYHEFRRCKNCGRVEKSFNETLSTQTTPSGRKIISQEFKCDWVQVDESELVAEKI